MINLCFVLSNPFSNRFGGVYEKSGKTWMPNKFWELGVYKTNSIILFTFNFTIRGDHAGLKFDFGILGLDINFMIYDNRHWDYDNDCWETYEGNK